MRYYSPKLYATIPIFMILTLLYNALWWYQHKTFANFYPPILEPSGNYHMSQANLPLVIINILVFIWGLNILRDACSMKLI